MRRDEIRKAYRYKSTEGERCYADTALSQPSRAAGKLYFAFVVDCRLAAMALSSSRSRGSPETVTAIS